MEVAKWSSDVEVIIDDDAIWYPLDQDIANLPAFTRDSILYRLGELQKSTRLFEAPYGEPGRRFKGFVNIPSKRAWLPPKLYRAVHSGYNGNGLYARGFRPDLGDKIAIDKFNFHLHAENHFCWWSRAQGPFLSLTADLDWAVRICRIFERQNRSGVLLLETDAASWMSATNDDIWAADEIVRTLDIPWKDYYVNEYLAVDQIPAQHVRSITWT